MALRNIKIVRDIVQTCNRYLTKADLTTFSTPKAPALPEKLAQNEFRYEVANKAKSVVAPNFDFIAKEPERQLLSEMPHLQPSKQSQCVKVNMNSKYESVWEPHNDTHSSREFQIRCPFPEPIIEPQWNSIRFSEKTKHKQPSLNVALKGQTRKMHTLARHYAMLPLNQCRYSSNKKSPKEQKCKKVKQRCIKNQTCPRFIMPTCPFTKGSDCQHLYKANECAKKMAPYPSYSESCVQRLEDDPSECFQCPWQKCGGIDSIKIPKPPRNKGYHTSTRPLNMAMIPIMNACSASFVTQKECDARKAPCKPPPPKCQKQVKKKKCPVQKKERGKKCISEHSPEYMLWCAKEQVVPLDKIDEADFKQNDLKEISCLDTPGKCPPKPNPTTREVDRSIDRRYKPWDPCCERARRERTKTRKPRKKPKVYVPEERPFPA